MKRWKVTIDLAPYGVMPSRRVRYRVSASSAAVAASRAHSSAVRMHFGAAEVVKVERAAKDLGRRR